jgi:hypothetical protein
MNESHDPPSNEYVPEVGFGMPFVRQRASQSESFTNFNALGRGQFDANLADTAASKPASWLTRKASATGTSFTGSGMRLELATTTDFNLRKE